LVDGDDHREHTDRDTGDESTDNEHSDMYSSCLDGTSCLSAIAGVGHVPITAIKAPSWMVLFRPIRSAVCPAIKAPTTYQRYHFTSLTERSSGENRDDSSGDTGVGVLEVGVELVIAVRNDRSDDSRVVTE
jgi:hypothetical protein